MTIERYKEIKLEILRLKMLRAKAEAKCAKIEYKIYKSTGEPIENFLERI